MILKRDVRSHRTLKRNARLMVRSITTDTWVSWKYMLNDLPLHATTLYTDASTSFGAGAWFGDLGIQFAWEQLEGISEFQTFWKKEEQINVLELFVIFVTAVYWKKKFRGHLIDHLGDKKSCERVCQQEQVEDMPCRRNRARIDTATKKPQLQNPLRTHQGRRECRSRRLEQGMNVGDYNKIGKCSVNKNRPQALCKRRCETLNPVLFCQVR